MNPAALSAILAGDFANAIAASTPGGIEAQEAAGQRKLVESQALPRQIYNASRDQLTELGFKFGPDADDLFVYCELPTGWTKRATEHSMHSELLDEQGRIRASIFYKAAFYDKKAQMRFHRRFNVDAYAEGSRDEHMRCVVTDGGAVVFDAGECLISDHQQSDSMRAACQRWLNDNYPDSSAFAYW